MYRDGIFKVSNFRNKVIHDAVVGKSIVICTVLFWI